MRRYCIAAMFVVGMISSALSASAADWGNLKGRFVYDGNAPEPKAIVPDKDVEYCSKHKLYEESLVVGKDGGLANAFIWVRSKKVPVHPDYEKTANAEVVIDNKHCRFEPHVQLLRTTQTLVVTNTDPIGHNSNVTHITTPQNVIVASGQKSELKFPDEMNFPAPVSCNIHPWMKAHVLIRQSPYMAIADADGNFEIKNLPAGKEWEFQLWQENPGNLKNAQIKGVKVDSKGRFKYKLKKGENDLGTIKVSSKIFKFK